MKKNTLLIGLLLVSGTLAAQDWPTVQTEARPGSRWWWMGNTVDIPNLTYNIDEYAKAGLGTLEVTPIYGQRTEIPVTRMDGYVKAYPGRSK